MNSELETLRRSYMPSEISVLFIGESPPAGGTFFYKGNSNLSKYTMQAFERTFDHQFETQQDFLRYFKKMGCYLDDLCLSPVNQFKGKKRRDLQRACVENLTQRLKEHRQPDVVISVKRDIRELIEEAVKLVGWKPTKFYKLPFPASGNQTRYTTELVDALQELREAGILI